MPWVVGLAFLPLLGGDGRAWGRVWAAFGLPTALERRPVWALVGLGFLLLWPTKWAQYLLLVLPPLCVCAGLGVSTAWELAVSVGRRRAESRPRPLQG